MSTSKTFGAFFRARRKTFGLTLSEFCRRNGFDKGNISRLERSLVPPPQVRELLETYAKALKLEDGSGSWETFFELAAVETGRIPSILLEDQHALRKLPGLLRQIRAGGQGHSGWVTALDLERWADSLDARATLPELVRRLVRAKVKDRRVEFPSGDQVQRPGWDGLVVDADEGHEFVPAGTSVWELGVEKLPKQKAEKDYFKRTKDPLGLDREKTTICFVTLRKWQDKENWRRAKQDLGEWKEVGVYDSATLEEWLEQSPAVDVWLAGMLGKKPPGLTTIDDHWANLQAMTDPSLKPEVFLASREKEVDELQTWLHGPPGAMVIQARAQVESIDFVAAFSRDPAHEDWFGARALIVETRDAWRDVSAATDAGLLLIAHPSLAIEQELVADALRRGHRVLVSSTQPPREGVPSLRLPRVYRHDLEKALVSSGLDVTEASKKAREAGGSLTILRRLLGRLPEMTRPDWSQPLEAATLVPMLLAGSWDESSEADRSALGTLAGRPYRDIVEVAVRWRMASDPPLAHIGSRWSLVSRDDSWHLLASTVTSHDFDRFERVVEEVLVEDDPSLELPFVQMWSARAQNKEPRYSQALRNGLAETIAILGAKPERLSGVFGVEGRIENIVRQLLEGQGRLRWASLSDQLPLLAEAAPDAFLKAVERDLSRSNAALIELIESKDDSLFTANEHAGLLRALEALAWNRAMLPQVSLILATLDESPVWNRLGDSAFRSLREIFTPGLPQTTATLAERVKILEMLTQRKPDVSWRLLPGLLLNQELISMPIQRPLWQDWALGWSRGVTNAAYWHQVSACARLLIERLGEDIERWRVLIERFENLPGPFQTEFLERLSRLSESTLAEETRSEVSDAIRAKVSLHRKFASAQTALPRAILGELEKVQHQFEPLDPVRKNVWLFAGDWQVLEWREDLEQPADELRRSAVRQILDQEGWVGIRRLIREAEAPEAVGVTFTEIGSDEDDSRILPCLLTSDDEKAFRFCGAYIGGRFRKEGWGWVNRFKMDSWSVEQIARFLGFLPFTRRTWEFAAARGDDVSRWYWNNPPFPRGEERDDASFAVTMLLNHKRSFEAFVVLQTALHRKVALESSLLMDAIETWLATGGGGVGRIQGFEYLILSLFQELQRRVAQKDPGFDLNRLAELEWRCLGLLNGHPASPITLHGLLRDEPEFFVEVLSLVFRPKDQPAEDSKEISEEERQRAQNAYRLLRSWRKIPGSRDDRPIDATELLAWVHKARSLAKDRGLLEICDSRIGEVLAHDSYGYDLQLMSSVKDVSAIPIAGKKLIILALVAQNLYFRIFDGDGNMVVDTDATRLTEKVEPIEDFRRQLETLWPLSELTEIDRIRVNAAVASIVDFPPHDEDDSWPSIPVRDALEEIDTDEVFEGFSVGIYNKRGMVSKSLREGGVQERDLAAKYQVFADANKIEWPRTAKALRDVAKRYEEEAHREDERASLEE